MPKRSTHQHPRHTHHSLVQLGVCVQPSQGLRWLAAGAHRRRRACADRRRSCRTGRVAAVQLRTRWCVCASLCCVRARASPRACSALRYCKVSSARCAQRLQCPSAVRPACIESGSDGFSVYNAHIAFIMRTLHLYCMLLSESYTSGESFAFVLALVYVHTRTHTRTHYAPHHQCVMHRPPPAGR